jgi:predicted permease
VSLWRQLTHGMRALICRSGTDQDIDDEVRHFYEETVAAHVAKGLSVEDANRAARIEVGSPAGVAEQVRTYGWENILTTSLSDLRFAARVLRKSPVFTAVVVVVVSLGSGALTTLFSALNALVLRPVPSVAEADRLVTLAPVRSDGLLLQQGSFADYSHLRSRTHTLDGVAAWGKVILTLSSGQEGTIVAANMVSGNYFDVLGVRPYLGRFFAPDEDRTPLAHPVIVVSRAFWSTRLGGNPDIVGRSLLVNGNPFTLVGVAPASFRGVYTGVRADAWVPLMMQPLLRPRANLSNSSWLWMFGHLKDGSSTESAQTELAALTRAHAQELGEPRGPTGFRSVNVFPFSGLPGGEEDVILRFLASLLVAALLVFVIAGINVAAMLMARSVARGRELAVRAALGAGRMRLVRQLLVEILLLFAFGAIGGLALSVLATHALEQMAVPINLPIFIELSPDARVLAFALTSAVIVGLIFGIAPALAAVRVDITSRLRDDSAGSRWRPSRINRILLVGQLSLSLVLLVAAGLFMRALTHGQNIDPGFQMTHVATTTFEAESWGYDEARTRAFYATLRSRLGSIRQVAAVGYVSRLPLTGGSTTEDIEINGSTIGVQIASVDPGFFSVLRIPIIKGRAFADADDERGQRVAIVNHSLARQLSPDGDAIGQTFRFLGKPATIVGVVRDAKYSTLGEHTPPFVYFPVAQLWRPTQSLVVRTADDAEWLGPAIQQTILAIDPAVPRPAISALKDATSIVLLPQRVAALVTGVLGGVGLLLSCVGLYGVMAHSVQRRTREIGIRLALGAQPSTVLGMVVREGFSLAVVAVLIGLVLAAAAARAIEGFLFTVSPFDPAAFAGMSLIFLSVAFVACYLAARRTATADPLAALRTD